MPEVNHTVMLNMSDAMKKELVNIINAQTAFQWFYDACIIALMILILFFIARHVWSKFQIPEPTIENPEPESEWDWYEWKDIVLGVSVTVLIIVCILVTQILHEMITISYNPMFWGIRELLSKNL